MTRAQTRARLEQALSRLLAGQPTCTDGQLTVTNLCREADVGRDSFYRIPDLVSRFQAAKANAAAHQPELVHLRDQVTALTRQLKAVRRNHAAALRELEETVQIYANQIQALTLRNSELNTANQRLNQALDRAASNITSLHTRPATPETAVSGQGPHT